MHTYVISIYFRLEKTQVSELREKVCGRGIPLRTVHHKNVSITLRAMGMERYNMGMERSVGKELSYANWTFGKRALKN